MQHRYELVLEFWDRSKYLSTSNTEYRNFSLRLLTILLENDIRKGDLTTSSLPLNKKISAEIISKEKGILSGLEEYKLLNRGFKIKSMKNDGDKIKNGDVILQIHGSASEILKRERVSLNILQRMSGIATLAAELSKKLSRKIKLAATRKTLWGSLDKKAVSLGGGLTHRLSLNDGIIIKDNHLKILNDDVEKAITLAKNKSSCIEIEVENSGQALRAATAIKKIRKPDNKTNNLFAIMFDKMRPTEINNITKEFKKRDLYDYVLLEASGNITASNIMSYNNCGVDVVSLGSLTNSSPSLNMSQEIIN